MISIGSAARPKTVNLAHRVRAVKQVRPVLLDHKVRVEMSVRLDRRD